MFGQALSLYRRQFAAVVLTSALTLIPADLLMVGVVRVGVAGLTTGLPAKGPANSEGVKQGPPEARGEQVRELGKEAAEKPDTVREQLERALPFLYALVIITVLLLAGAGLAL